jgi:outer membrane protein TolC
LAIQNINQALLTANNNRKIINYQLNVAIGLPTETIIQPSQTSAIMANGESLDYYFNVAFESNPFIQSSQKNILLASKNVDIIKTDLLPGISAVGGYNMQRPLTSSIPASDLYLNAWQVGLSLNFSIDNLFKTKERVKSGKLVEKQAQQVLEVVKQNIATGINAAYVKYQEAIAQSNLAKEAKRLADENYKIIEAKYLNQLVVQAEMIDAQNQKIQSDIDYSNSLVNISFQYYNLIKATGTL